MSKRRIVDRALTFTGTQADDYKARGYVNPEVAMIHNMLWKSTLMCRMKGWVFNRENHYPLTPTADGDINVPE